MRVFFIIGDGVKLWCDTHPDFKPSSFDVINGGYRIDIVPEPEDMPKEVCQDYNTAIDWMQEKLNKK